MLRLREQLATIKLPTNDEMNDMDIETLKEWRDKLAPFYEQSIILHKVDYQAYHKANRYFAFERMIENIEAGKDRWERISNYGK